MHKIYYNQLIEALRIFASYDEQKLGWFENNQNIVSSFADDYAAVFEDTGLEYALENSPVVFGQAADQALRDLDKATNLVDEINWSEEKILNSPEMEIVRQKAAIALKLVQQSTAEGRTVEYLN